VQGIWRAGLNWLDAMRAIVLPPLMGIIQLWFIYFAASFFKALGNVNVKYLKIPE